jgi:hypothetical protein
VKEGSGMKSRLTRRTAVTFFTLVAASTLTRRALASELTAEIAVTKDRGCGCCGAWVEHLKAAGFAVNVTESASVNRLKAKLGVPSELASCHTAEIEGYVIEGHVPATAIRRLLAERPQGRGLAVPGMPVGSPGMEVAGAPADTYDVVLFGAFGKRVFARFEGASELRG